MPITPTSRRRPITFIKEQFLDYIYRDKAAADFDIPKIIQTKKMSQDFPNTIVLTTPSGSRGWMPPELFESDRFDFNLDVYGHSAASLDTL